MGAQYELGSVWGRKHRRNDNSASQSFKVANSLSSDVKGGFFGNGGGGGIGFEWAQSQTDTQSLDIKKSNTSTLSRNGPAQDGINHDEDQIWLLLNPSVNLALSNYEAAWLLSETQSSPIQYVYAGWLNGMFQCHPL
jgi:hypothetical protein